MATIEEEQAFAANTSEEADTLQRGVSLIRAMADEARVKDWRPELLRTIADYVERIEKLRAVHPGGKGFSGVNLLGPEVDARIKFYETHVFDVHPRLLDNLADAVAALAKSEE